MSCCSARRSMPMPSASFARGLSSEPKSSVSPGSMSFRRNFLPSVTRNGFAKPRARLRRVERFMSGADDTNGGSWRGPRWLSGVCGIQPAPGGTTMSRPVLAIATTLLVLGGCSRSPTTTQAQSVRTSGFLGDYSRLKPGGKGQALLVYLAPYTKVLLDRVTVWGSENAANVPPGEMQHLANLLYGQFMVSLRTYYVLVDKPGPGTLHIRAALTEAKPADTGLNIWSNIGPVGRTVNATSEMTTGTAAFVGAAAGEIEIRDAETNAILLQAVDGRVGTHTLTDADDKWEAVEASFQIWTHRLV